MLAALDGDSSEEDEVISSTSNNITSSKISSSSVEIEDKKSIIRQDQSKSMRSILLQQPEDEEDEEDEDAPLLNSIQLIEEIVATEMTESTTAIQSEECSDALQAVESDCWDINSWILFIDEVEADRGGNLSVPEAYHRFLDKFPRAAKQWKALAEYHANHSEFGLAEEVYNKSLLKCRSVELWQSYVQMVQQKFLRLELEL
jgi:hypothetical protein